MSFLTKILFLLKGCCGNFLDPELLFFPYQKLAAYEMRAFVVSDCSFEQLHNRRYVRPHSAIQDLDWHRHLGGMLSQLLLWSLDSGLSITFIIEGSGLSSVSLYWSDVAFCRFYSVSAYLIITVHLNIL